MSETLAPFYGQVKLLMSSRDNPGAIVTSTKYGMFLEVRQPIEIAVPLVELRASGVKITYPLWKAVPGQVLMPFWKDVDQITLRTLGLRSPHVRKVMLIKDISAAQRQWARHTLNKLIEQRETVRGERIHIPGEYDRLVELVEEMNGKIGEPLTPDVIERAFRLLDGVRNGFKQQAAQALTAGETSEGRKNLAARADEILRESDGILRRIRELNRIINKMQWGFDTAYIRLYRVYTMLQAPKIQTEEIIEKVMDLIYGYLTRKVATFEPYYSWGHSPEVLALARVSEYMLAGKVRTVQNLVLDAMASIQKGVKGLRPEALEIRRVAARLTRRAEKIA